MAFHDALSAASAGQFSLTVAPRVGRDPSEKVSAASMPLAYEYFCPPAGRSAATHAESSTRGIRSIGIREMSPNHASCRLYTYTSISSTLSRQRNVELRMWLFHCWWVVVLHILRTHWL